MLKENACKWSLCRSGNKFPSKGKFKVFGMFHLNRHKKIRTVTRYVNVRKCEHLIGSFRVKASNRRKYFTLNLLNVVVKRRGLFKLFSNCFEKL